MIHGLNKLTLLDYPGRTACTVFLGNCNFRCPFCHNASLVLSPHTQPVISQQELFAYLTKRKGVLDGVCITGGEPTIYPELHELILNIKTLGYFVKLDTNGYRPQVVRSLLEEGLLDYLAMDIKNSLAKYPQTIGVNSLNLDVIRESVELLLGCNIEYEFRTTFVKEFHDENDVQEIGRLIKGARLYAVQSYTDSGDVLGGEFHAHDISTLHTYMDIARAYVRDVRLRGVD